MKILGIETSCDETSIAVVEVNGGHVSVLSNVVSSQVKTHAPYGGVVPMLAARDHAQNIGHVFDMAMKDADLTDPAAEFDLIAVTRGPGLGPALLQGLTFARALAMRWHKPIVGVNHMDGHIHSNWLPVAEASRTKYRMPDIPMPALNILVSGGHTELVLMRDHGSYERIGKTLDDAVGEAFDKVARLLGLGYPGGPALARLAEKGDATKYELPRPMLKAANHDFSYSGLKTAVLYLVQDLTGSSPSEPSGRYPLSEKQKADIAASFQEAAVDVLVKKTKRAAQEHDVRSILLSGGVSANALLRERMREMAGEIGITYSQPDLRWTGDNAAMIAAAGYHQVKKGNPTSPSDTVSAPQDVLSAPFTHSKQKTDTSWESVIMDANLRLGNTAGAS